MSRRVSMPAHEDIFRPTAVPDPPAEEEPAPPARRRKGEASGRVRHDEKMTVYVTAEELLEIEQARLTLRSQHQLAVDRGRLVREAVALALADLAEHGGESRLARRLAEQ